MGTKITIVNDTSTEWQCRVFGDQKLLKVIGYSAAGATIAALPFMFARLILPGGSSWLRVIKAAIIGGTTVGVISTAAIDGLSVLDKLNHRLSQNDFQIIEPYHSHEWAFKTPILWKQAVCVRYNDRVPEFLRVQTLLIRPIMIVRGHKHNLYVSISHWVKQNGVQTYDFSTVGKMEAARQSLPQGIVIQPNPGPIIEKTTSPHVHVFPRESEILQLNEALPSPLLRKVSDIPISMDQE